MEFNLGQAQPSVAPKTENIELKANKQSQEHKSEFSNPQSHNKAEISHDKRSVHISELRPEVAVNVRVNIQRPDAQAAARKVNDNQHIVIDDFVSEGAHKASINKKIKPQRKTKRKGATSVVYETADDDINEKDTVKELQNCADLLDPSPEPKEQAKKVDKLKDFIEKIETFDNKYIENARSYNSFKFISHIVFLPLGLLLNLLESTPGKRVLDLQDFIKIEQAKNPKLLDDLKERDIKLYEKTMRIKNQKMGTDDVKHRFKLLWKSIKIKAQKAQKFIETKVLGKKLSDEIKDGSKSLTRAVRSQVKGMMEDTIKQPNLDKDKLNKRLEDSIDSLKSNMGSIRATTGKVFDKVFESAGKGVEELRKSSPDLVSAMSKALSKSNISKPD